MKNKVAIIGYGYVGKAMHKIFPDALIYDTRFIHDHPDGREEKYLSVAEAERVHTLASKADINTDCGLAIICVPTPMQESTDEFKKVDLSIVEATVGWLETPLILIKSTVPPGTTDRLNDDVFLKYQKVGKLLDDDVIPKICFSPEYIGEGKYQITEWKYMSPTDPRTHEFVIIGGQQEARERIANYFVKQLGPEKQYYLIDAVEAEIVKYMENAWGGLKVIFAQEFYDLCQKFGASYIRVREGWALDNRVERMHTAVFVDSRGFGGKCYPKDLNGIVAAGDSVGADMSLIKAALRKNKDLKQHADPEI